MFRVSSIAARDFRRRDWLTRVANIDHAEKPADLYFDRCSAPMRYEVPHLCEWMAAKASCWLLNCLLNSFRRRSSSGSRSFNRPIDVRDPLAERLRNLASAAGPSANRLAPAMLGIREVFGAPLRVYAAIISDLVYRIFEQTKQKRAGNNPDPFILVGPFLGLCGRLLLQFRYHRPWMLNCDLCVGGLVMPISAARSSANRRYSAACFRNCCLSVASSV
jgi:hypothetical protein